MYRQLYFVLVLPPKKTTSRAGYFSKIAEIFSTALTVNKSNTKSA
jgi:hypothetical protein